MKNILEKAGTERHNYRDLFLPDCHAEVSYALKSEGLHPSQILPLHSVQQRSRPFLKPAGHAAVLLR